MALTKEEGHILALDIGDKRVGVALASLKTCIANPLITLNNDQELISKLKKSVSDYDVQTIVVGLPRSLEGNDSQQTIKTRELISRLRSDLNVRVVTQDEALSSVRAEDELSKRDKIFARADVDKLAACLILEDYINDKV